MRRLAAAVREPSTELLLGVLLAGVLLAAAVVRGVVSSKVAAPQILCDEFIYAGIARSVAEGDGLAFRGVGLDFSYVYPALIAPAWAAEPMETTFDLVKAINVVVMTLAAIPVYLWARRLVSPLWALVAVVLVLLLPAFAFTGLVMTENAAFPTFLAAALAVAYALERPVVWAQAVALGALLLAAVTRYQSAVLIGALVLAVPLKLLLDRQAGIPAAELRRRALLHARLLGTLAAAAVVYVAYQRLQTGRWAAVLGPYEDLGSGSYPLRDVARWSILHAGELVFASAVVPACALVVVLAGALRGRTRDEAERAFLAVAVPAVLLVIVQIGAFAARVAGFVVERYTFYVLPLLLLALVLWLGRGLPRPRWTAVGAAAGSVVAVVVLLEEFRDLLFQPSLPVNTLSLYAVQRLPQRLDGDETRAVVVIAVAAAVAALAFMLLPRPVGRVLLPLGVAVTLAVLARPVAGATEGLAATAHLLTGPEAAWVDERVGAGADAALIVTPHPDVYTSSGALLQLEFWNRSIDEVLLLGGSEVCPLPSGSVVIDQATGEIQRVLPQGTERVDDPYVVVQRGTAVHGELLAQGGPELTIPLSLYRVIPPLRIEHATDGIYTDGWMSADATYSRYAAPAGGGTMEISLSRTAWTGPDVPGRTRIRLGRLTSDAAGVPKLVDVTTTRWTIHSGAARTFQLPAPPPPFRVEVHIEPTFSPAEFGFGDTRQLGAQVGFTYVPAAG